MLRAISGLRRDDAGEWISDLECGHSQHVRHAPHFQERPWVVHERDRAQRVGSPLDCPRCDRRGPVEPEELGGDPACWAGLLCDECGRPSHRGRCA